MKQKLRMLIQTDEEIWKMKDLVNDIKNLSCKIHKYFCGIKHRHWKSELEGYIDNKR